MTTLQLRVQAVRPDGLHPVDVWLWPAGAEHPSCHGLLLLRAEWIQRLQQGTPVLEQLQPDWRIAWTGIPIVPLPAEPRLARAMKLLRGIRRLFVDDAEPAP